jgi:hypothetical protein
MDDDGALAPPYVITASDKRGLVVVIAATTLSFVWTCLLIRIYLRLKLREWKLDDYLLVAATVSSLPLFVCCAARCSLGYFSRLCAAWGRRHHPYQIDKLRTDFSRDRSWIQRSWG